MKYFVVSDIHSYFQPLFKSLSMTGYDPKNSSHTLVVLGDIFDRGPETLEVYNFLSSIPKKNIKLIRGNHEGLYFELLKKTYPDLYDFSNGTVNTFCQIADIPYETFLSKEIDEQMNLWNQEIVPKVKSSPVTKWLKSRQWLKYWEVDNYIFVHAFIPLYNKSGIDIFDQYNNYDLNYFSNWRTDATKKEWYEASWVCPWQLNKKGYFDEEASKGKVLVCGHWLTSDFHYHLNNLHQNYEIYYSPNFIGLDGCVAFTYRQNVLVIEGDTLKDRYGRDLKTLTYKDYSLESADKDDYSSPIDYYSRVTYCHADCDNKLCARNLNYNVTYEKYCTVSDLSTVCKSYKEKKK